MRVDGNFPIKAVYEMHILHRTEKSKSKIKFYTDTANSKSI